MLTPIIILDFGSQYTQLLARRVREMGVYCEIYPWNSSADTLQKLSPCGVILSGGPSSVNDTHPLTIPDYVFDMPIPLLGICYGMQAMARQLGGEVASSSRREYGHAQVRICAASPLLEGVCNTAESTSAKSFNVWMSHGDHVTLLPPHFESLCTTENTPIAGMMHTSRQWYGLQFHPEVTHTQHGQAILARFVLDICKAPVTWTTHNIIDESIAYIREHVGTEDVILGLSGGVDSSVVAALLHRAIGSQLKCVFVDTGLLRRNEVDHVLTMFAEHMPMDIHVVSASEEFYAALQGEACPEKKRKIIGKTFIDVFTRAAQRFDGAQWLAQGTIYPDVIESAAASHGTAAVIKSHHNVGGLPETMALKLLEPIRELFKDEVRKVGEQLGLPHAMLYRHPFPGPGLGVRVLGEVKPAYVETLRMADAIFIEELYASNLYYTVSQAFAVFLPIKSVGVMGDGRRYEHVIALRAVETTDFMTASWAQLPWDFLARVSNRIINEISGVSRVVYDVSGKPPATIEWE